MSLADLAQKQLVWTQLKAMQKSYELRDGAQVVGKLVWEKMFGSLAVGEVEGQRWTFKREGFFRPRVTVRRAGETENLAVMELGWTGAARVSFADGHGYSWVQKSSWAGAWGFVHDNTQPAVSFKLEKSLLKTGAQVKVEELKVDEQELALLLALGWYVLVLYTEDSVPTGM